ncbi:MAG TPA: primase-helicase family protein [Terrimicrobiaceae bacterium]
MSSHNSDLREKIEEAKNRLPLPSLLERFGLQVPNNGEGNLRSPFAKGRRQKSPSFSIFRKNGAWGWCDRTGGQELKRDEIDFIEQFDKIQRAEAIRRYLSMAGVVDGVYPTAHKEAFSANSPKPIEGLASNSLLDWPACVAKFTDDHAARLAELRGYSLKFVCWMRDQSLIGIRKDGIAFPVHRSDGALVAAHIRPRSGRWFYHPRGAGCHPFIVGSAKSAKQAMVFESQWDAFAVMEALGWHESAPEGWAIVMTRGASNGRFASAATGAVYAWPQNDPEKDGKRAGEMWLADVAAAAPGAVFRVVTPPEFKDANDWARASRVDVWAAIEGAKPVRKPPSRFEMATGGPIRPIDEPRNQPPARPTVDPNTVLDEMGMYWLNGSGSYFLRSINGRDRFLEMGVAEIRRKLRVRGFRSRPDAEGGEKVSQLDCILDAATEHQAVDLAVSIGGMASGVYDMQGGRVLVRESPRLIKPISGSCETILDFLFGLLGAVQMDYLLSWLKLAYQALLASERRPGQCLIIVGPPDCGKSRIQHQLITPLLAGRSADPKSFFFGRTDFNAELVGAEHLLIEEVPASTRHEDRQFFGERIKEIVANDTARLHKKNRDAVTVCPFWRLSITVNNNPEKLRSLPPLTDDLAEKIILLEANPCPEFWSKFENSSDPRIAFREAVTSELPAFADFLLKMEIPTALVGRRYGVRSYISEELAQTLFESEPEHHLLILIDKELWREQETVVPWQGDAEDLKQALTSESSSVRASASRLLGAYPTACGQYLARLASKLPDRFEKKRTAEKRGWRINPPAS